MVFALKVADFLITVSAYALIIGVVVGIVCGLEALSAWAKGLKR